VQISYFLESQDEDRHCLHVHKDDLMSSHDLEEVSRLEHALSVLMNQQKYIDNGGVALFAELQSKVDLMVWLLDEILQGGDTFANSNYHHQLEVNRSLDLPETSRSTKVFPLLEAYFNRVEDYITELSEVVDNSVHGKVFMYQNKALKPFATEHYIQGLDKAAKGGNWLAQVIILLVEKLNLYEKLFLRLKLAYKKLSNHESWPISMVNLAAGGFAVHLPQNYAKGDRVCCLFKMDQQFVFARAVCVYQGEGEKAKRTAFQFEEISSEDEAHIVRFLRSKELEQRNLD